MNPAMVTLLVLAAVVAPANAQAGTDWIPYTIQYHETTQNPQEPRHTYTTTEIRYSDGSWFMTSVSDTGREQGKLWEQSGDLYSLDFANNHAVYLKNSPRQHLGVPNFQATGSDIVAGVSCTVYPVDVKPSGNGTLCVDTAHDILLREEIHMDGPKGALDYKKEASSVDFSKPARDEKASLPPGFEFLKPSK